MFFSFTKYGNDLNKKSLVKIGKRSFLIFAIGLFLNSFPQWQIDFSQLRIMGVLQRIAVVYLISSLIVLSLKKKEVIIVGVSLLLLHWLAVYVLGGNSPYSLEDNATIPFDSFVLGEAHLYRGFGIPFDPEGLFSSISATVTVLIGYGVGVLIKEVEKVKLPSYLLMGGIVFIILGLVWSLVLPLNKPLWTASYVVYTAGLAMVLLSLLVWLVDIKGYQRWTTSFVVFGMNPLFIFALSGLWVKFLVYIERFSLIDKGVPTATNAYVYLYEQVFVLIAGPMNGSLLFAIAHVIFFWFIGWVLYRKRIFIKV